MGLNKRTHARQESCMYEQQKFLNIGRYEVVQSVKSYTQFKRQTTYKNKNKTLKVIQYLIILQTHFSCSASLEIDPLNCRITGSTITISFPLRLLLVKSSVASFFTSQQPGALIVQQPSQQTFVIDYSQQQYPQQYPQEMQPYPQHWMQPYPQQMQQYPLGAGQAPPAYSDGTQYQAK